MCQRQWMWTVVVFVRLSAALVPQMEGRLQLVASASFATTPCAAVEFDAEFDMTVLDTMVRFGQIHISSDQSSLLLALCALFFAPHFLRLILCSSLSALCPPLLSAPHSLLATTLCSSFSAPHSLLATTLCSSFSALHSLLATTLYSSLSAPHSLLLILCLPPLVSDELILLIGCAQWRPFLSLLSLNVSDSVLTVSECLSLSLLPLAACWARFDSSCS